MTEMNMTPSNTHSRRHFLASSAMNIGGVALATLLQEEGLLAAPAKPELERPTYDLLPKAPHHPATAKAMIYLFMQGAPSQMDLFDRKPALEQMEGKPYPHEMKLNERLVNKLLPSPWKFARYGKSGIEMSTLLPHMGSVVDDICVVRSMRTGVTAHDQSIKAMLSGRNLPGRPSLGSWTVYGLGSETQNLPAFVSLPHPALAGGGVGNWSNGWLPSLYQGTMARATEPRILNLNPPKFMQGEPQNLLLAEVERLNRRHLERHPGESDLEARVSNYQLAARMQLAATDAFDLSQESADVKRMYGVDDPACSDFAERCLISRRLVERGVRFVHISTQAQFWDHHTAMATRLPKAVAHVDRPTAALIRDLKQRGLLDSTVVAWGGEHGRLPIIEQGQLGIGRDHNTEGFTMLFAGGGFKGGHTYGNTDEFGYRAVENIVHHYDYLATVLHQFGLDHKKLVYQRNNRELTLTDGQDAHVVHDILC